MIYGIGQKIKFNVGGKHFEVSRDLIILYKKDNGLIKSTMHIKISRLFVGYMAGRDRI